MMVYDAPTTLWRLRKDGRWVEALVHLVPVGIEVESVINGFAIGSRIFDKGDEALAWAAEEHRAFQADVADVDADQLDGASRQHLTGFVFPIGAGSSGAWAYIAGRQAFALSGGWWDRRGKRWLSQNSSSLCQQQ